MTKGTKRVDAVDSATVLVRAKDGSAFAKWFVCCSLSLPLALISPKKFQLIYIIFVVEIFSDECKKNVPVALISMHDCSLEAKIKMNLGNYRYSELHYWFNLRLGLI